MQFNILIALYLPIRLMSNRSISSHTLFCFFFIIFDKNILIHSWWIHIVDIHCFIQWIKSCGMLKVKRCIAIFHNFQQVWLQLQSDLGILCIFVLCAEWMILSWIMRNLFIARILYAIYRSIEYHLFKVAFDCNRYHFVILIEDNAMHCFNSIDILLILLSVNNRNSFENWFREFRFETDTNNDFFDTQYC